MPPDPSLLGGAGAGGGGSPGVEPMSTQTQTPKTLEFFFAPLYTRKELERALKKLNEKLEEIFSAMHSILSLVDDIYSYMYHKNLATEEELGKVRELRLELSKTLEDIVDAIIVRELKLDVDIKKYEERYNVSFPYESERQLGVALLKENETVKPVVVWTDYKEVGYYEGERDE